MRRCLPVEQFFDESKDTMMKELLDFKSREDFDNYMKGLEEQ